MSAALDMSLDDIINNINNKRSGSASSRGRSRGSGSGPGPARRFPNRAANRGTPYTIGQDIPIAIRWPTNKTPETAWQHDMYADQPVHVAAYPGQAGRASSIETGTKLYVSNLDYGVSDDDIKELFSEFGDLKRHTVHYDRSGRSKGTAEVVFSRRADAVAAVKRYNNVQLDGKPMKVEIVGTNIATHAVAPAANVGFGNSNAVPRSGQGRSGAFGRPRGGGGRGRGIRRGRGRGRGRGEKVSAEDLDADLEKYHAEAMQLN